MDISDTIKQILVKIYLCVKMDYQKVDGQFADSIVDDNLFELILHHSHGAKVHHNNNHHLKMSMMNGPLTVIRYLVDHRIRVLIAISDPNIQFLIDTNQIKANQ